MLKLVWKNQNLKKSQGNAIFLNNSWEDKMAKVPRYNGVSSTQCKTKLQNKGNDLIKVNKRFTYRGSSRFSWSSDTYKSICDHVDTNAYQSIWVFEQK